MTSHVNDLFIPKKLLYRVDGEMKHENFQSNELIRIKLPLQEDYKAVFRALTHRSRLISNFCILGEAMECGLSIFVSD